MPVKTIQQRMAGCKRGSVKYRKLKATKARIQGREARRNREARHELTTRWQRQYGDLTIILPKDVKGLTESARGDARDHGAAVGFKAMVNDRILSFAPYFLRQAIAYKMAEAGARLTLQDIDEEHPSRVGEAVSRVTKAARKARRTTKRTKANG